MFLGEIFQDLSSPLKNYLLNSSNNLRCCTIMKSMVIALDGILALGGYQLRSERTLRDVLQATQGGLGRV